MGSLSAKQSAEAKYYSDSVIQGPFMPQEPNQNNNQQPAVVAQNNLEQESLQRLQENSDQYDVAQQNLIDRFNDLGKAMEVFTDGLKKKNQIEDEQRQAQEQCNIEQQ